MNSDLTKAIELAEKATEQLQKSHVKQYTRSDGTVVREHDDSRQKQAGEHDDMEPVKKFKKGDKVKDQYGNHHEVLEQRGNSVKTYQSGSNWIHASKLWHKGE